MLKMLNVTKKNAFRQKVGLRFQGHNEWLVRRLNRVGARHYLSADWYPISWSGALATAYYRLEEYRLPKLLSDKNDVQGCPCWDLETNIRLFWQEGVERFQWPSVRGRLFPRCALGQPRIPSEAFGCLRQRVGGALTSIGHRRHHCAARRAAPPLRSAPAVLLASTVARTAATWRTAKPCTSTCLQPCTVNPLDGNKGSPGQIYILIPIITTRPLTHIRCFP